MVQPTRRLFFALWPDPVSRSALARWAQEVRPVCGGRVMRPEGLHLTLAFLGDVPANRFDSACAAAGQVSASPFDLVLDRLACWSHNHIVWAGPSVLPPALSCLADDLAQSLGRAGFELEKRRFAAHVTLLRKALCLQVLPQPPVIPWAVRDFVLLESKPTDQGMCYQAQGRWPLAH